MVRYGFVPRTITGVSIMLVFSGMFLDLVFVKMLMMRSLRSGEIVIGGLIRAFFGHNFIDLGLFQFRVLWLDLHPLSTSAMDDGELLICFY